MVIRCASSIAFIRSLSLLGLAVTLLGCHDGLVQPESRREELPGLTVLIDDALLEQLARELGDTSLVTVVNNAVRSAPDITAAHSLAEATRLDHGVGPGEGSAHALIEAAFALTLDRIAQLTNKPDQSH